MAVYHIGGLFKVGELVGGGCVIRATPYSFHCQLLKWIVLEFNSSSIALLTMCIS